MRINFSVFKGVALPLSIEFEKTDRVNILGLEYSEWVIILIRVLCIELCIDWYVK